MTESERRLIIDLWESRMRIDEIVKMLPCDEKTARGYIKALKDEGVLAAEKLKSDVSEDNELHEALNKYLKRDYFGYIDERCKELMEGLNYD